MKYILTLFILITPLTTNGQKLVEILIIGNSLSYYNQMPQQLEELSNSKDYSFDVDCLCKPNYAIIDHLQELEKISYIDSLKKYDIIILQQGPSSQEEGKNLLIESGLFLKKFEVHLHSRIYYLSVWPSLQYYHTFDASIQNYKQAASSLDFGLIPIGDTWKRAIANDSTDILYSQDGFHPSNLGSQFVAKNIYTYLVKALKNDK